MHRRLILILILCCCMPLVLEAQERKVLKLKEWRFSRDGVTWEDVTIPHDWAIAGPFDKKWDLQTVAISQNGEEEATEKSGRSGALPWIGEGTYKTTVSLSEFPGHAVLSFDGAMSEPTVYVNGEKIGEWKYGYNAFRYDATPYLHLGDNEITVTLKNVEESSRWYPGAGLYRPVELIITALKRMHDWDTFVYTKDVTDGVATLSVVAKILQGDEDDDVVIEVLNNEGKTMASTSTKVGDSDIHETLSLPNAKLWSPESPYLYTLRLTLKDDKEVFDVQDVRFGVRTIKVDKDGFCLNGVKRKIKGVCLHHDLGPLGTAVNKAALIRQVKLLKDMGCDAIRTSHNMPSTMQMEVYDSLGMMVMAESFDMWEYPKVKNGYARFFDEWWERDITNLVMRHRNHPSCVMWSIGNEIPEQGSDRGVELSKKLQYLCHKLDPSRPVTQGLDRVREALRSGVAEVMDIPGLNYRDHEYLNAYNTLPHGFILGSETASTVSSRGMYKFPVRIGSNITHTDGQCSAYDVEYCWWSNLPEVDFALQDDYPWTIGQFVWTGFDYLGEPTPYDEYWPSRSSYFGIFDLAGLPKDRFYLYRSVWNKDRHTVHLLPHWSWKGREGETTPVYCYTDGVEGELFVNGKSQGRIHKDFSRHIQDIDPDSVNAQPLLDRYRLRWNNVRYEPGEIRVVVYDENGEIIGQDSRRTPSEPTAINFECDRQSLVPNGDDLCFVTISLVDKDGTEIPDATDEIVVEVVGQGTFRAMCNGDATSLEPFTEPRMHLFSGKVVVTLQAGQEKGKLHLTATDTARNLKGKFEIEIK